MKRWLRSILCLGLVALFPWAVLAEGTSGGDADGSAHVEAVAIERLATCSGPDTRYRETGIYEVKDEKVRLISRAYDEDDICWVQCEVLVGTNLRRVYTGIKRFDATTFDLDSVPEEASLDDRAKVSVTSKALYGPGDGYGAYAELTVDEGQNVTIVAIENGYAQVEWKTSRQSYRAWVPLSALQY